MPERRSLISIAADLDVTPPALYRAIAALEAQGVLERPARGRVRLRADPRGPTRRDPIART